MNLVERVKNIILSPKSEWEVIKPEKTDTVEFYKSYIVILAAIGPVASLIGGFMFGKRIPFVGTVDVSLGSLITASVVGYVLALVGVYVVALIINALASMFSGKSSSIQALKTIAYASTASWVGGIFMLIPALQMIGLLFGLYSLYLLYLGLPILMETPKEKALGYTAVVVVCTIIVYIVIVSVAASFVTIPGMNMQMPTGLGG